MVASKEEMKLNQERMESNMDDKQEEVRTQVRFLAAGIKANQQVII
jgi:hypothetical protein